MTSTESPTFAETADANLTSLRELIAALPAETAAKRPTPDEWSANEILAHLLGPPDEDFLSGTRRVLEEDTPQLALEIGERYFTPDRQGQSTEQLLSAVEEQYRQILEVARPLTAEQLQRRVSIPAFAPTPFPDTPTLGEWLHALFDLHLTDHLGQLRKRL